MTDRDILGDFERRLSETEKKIGELRAKPRSRLDVLQVFMPVIAGFLLAIVGYFLTGSVNNAINRQQLQLSQVAEMRGLILELSKSGADRESMEATALTLSAYGEYAVPPLLNMLQNGGDNSYLAAKEGLRAVGLTDQKTVCAQLRRVLQNRTRLFTWETHRAAVELAGELGCGESVHLLEDYHHAVRGSLAREDLMPYAGWLRPRPAPGRDKIAMVDSALTTAIGLLRQQPRR